jgi:hypothetical protein
MTKKNAKEFIVKMLNAWATQDNRCTRFPYYVTVRDACTEMRASNWGDHIYSDDDACVISFQDALIELWNEYIDSRKAIKEIFSLADDVHFENFIKGKDIYWPHYREEIIDLLNEWGYTTTITYEEHTVYKNYGVFLTIKDAEKHIKLARHHYENPSTYITCFTPHRTPSDTEKFIDCLFEYFGVERK